MVFDDIFPEHSLESELENISGCPVKWIPFSDCQEHTGYYISRDGKYVFVGITFSGFVQIKRVKIADAGARSKNSAPSFKRRNKNGLQCWASVPSAVYGAFVLRDTMPRIKLYHKDGNLANSSLDNLTIDEPDLISNLNAHSIVYKNHYNQLVLACINYSNLRIEQAEDIVSDSFIRMCNSKNAIYSAVKLWMFMIKQAVLTLTRDNRENEISKFTMMHTTSVYPADGNMEYLTVMNALPSECREVAEMIVEGYTQKEIAKKLGISQSWVNVLMKRARIITKQQGYF